MARVEQEESNQGERPVAKAPESATVRENRGQLLRRNHFELGIGAVGRLLIHSPSAKLRGMAKAASLHVVVSNFEHELGPQWFPGQVLALTPATLATRHAIDNLAGLGSLLRPMLPWVSGQRGFTVGVEELCQFPALLGAEARTNHEIGRASAVVEQAQQQ